MSPKSNPPHPDHGGPPSDTTAGQPGLAAPRTLDSADLLGEQGEVLIRHEGRIYRLRRTRLGKLILTA